jgi:hypothetical protein
VAGIGRNLSVHRLSAAQISFTASRISRFVRAPSHISPGTNRVCLRQACARSAIAGEIAARCINPKTRLLEIPKNVTGETKTSFKGYYRASTKQDTALIRSFVQFDGEGEVANARQREIGGHAAALLRNVCLRRDPHSSYADRDGYVPFGQLEDYTGGRSNGCTSWSPSDAGQIIPMVKDDPTTLYIYPEAADIDAVTQAVKAGRSLSPAGLYWNAACLKEIGSPKFWSKEILEPTLSQYSKDHPAPPQRPPPICKPQ